MKLQRAVDEFLVEQERVARRSPHTITAYRTDLDFMVATGNRTSRGKAEVASFTRDLVTETLKQTPGGPFSVKRRLAAMRTFARWGVGQRLWLADPTANVERVKIPESVADPFTADERARLMALDLNPPERAFRAVLYWTGFRLDSVLTLRRANVSFDAAWGDNRLGTIKTVGKGKREHALAMMPQLREELTTYFAVLRPTPNTLLFATRSGHPWDQSRAQKVLRRWGAAADVKHVHAHRFRYDFATRMHGQGMSVAAIRLLLNHRSLTTTQIYLRVSDEELATAMLSATAIGPERAPERAPEPPARVEEDRDEGAGLQFGLQHGGDDDEGSGLQRW